MGDNIGMLLFKEKQVRLLSMLATPNKEWHISDLSKAADVTYVHTSKFIKRCEESGLVKSEKHGRTKNLVLTEKGAEIVKSINSVMDKVNSQPKPGPQPAITASQPQK